MTISKAELGETSWIRFLGSSIIAKYKTIGIASLGITVAMLG